MVINILLPKLTYLYNCFHYDVFFRNIISKNLCLWNDSKIAEVSEDKHFIL